MSRVEGRELVELVIAWALGKKAEDVVVLDLHGLMDVADYFVIVTGQSQVQVQAISDAIWDGATAARVGPEHVEGRDAGRWALLDFIDVVVHVMLPDVRRYYALERLWADATIVRYDELGRPIAPGDRAAAGEVRP
jgi:ribosome-associated protein